MSIFKKKNTTKYPLFFDEKKGEMYFDDFKITKKKKFAIGMSTGMIILSIIVLLINYYVKNQ